MYMQKTAKKRYWFRRIAILLVCILLFSVIELIWSNTHITVSCYEVSSSKIAAPIRVVFLSDLHGLEFGPGNKRLLEKIAAQEPDMIALVGDIFNNNSDSAEINSMCHFIRACTELAPTCFSMGNHENLYSENGKEDIPARVRETGAVFLDDEFIDLEINGSDIRIAGYMGYYGNPHMMSSDPERIQLEQKFFQDYVATDRFKLLLNHIPTAWLDWGAIDRNRVDLVFSGHYHGGIIRIPFWNQGLYAPYVGWFPPYTKGVFAGKSATCILTTGLAGVECVPRFFNPPEIVLVEIKPEET